ncbi:MAG: leucine-rich repeat domain-containing protein, partial [Gemmatimonadota bacterium]|nr:leucine-rich repeat domain-containing protein [Gemmatimonadota bacterium]
DLTPLADLTSLTWLSLSNTGVSDLTPLAGLTNLTGLRLDSNSISDLTPLADLTSLTWLSLSNNSISDLTPLAGLTNLTGLRLDSNSILDLTPLAGLANLTELRLENNNISDLTSLAGLTNLIRLYLNANSISDLTPLVGLTNLATLWLGDNSISDLTPLTGLTNLTELRLENNSISDIAPLVENTGLGIGNWIDVRSNPLSDASINTYIPALQARGVISDGDGGETPVVIPDAKLHAAIADELGKASNAPITASEMATLSHLFALDSDIRELTGLEYAINLTALQLHNNFISDLMPLAGLTNLTELYLYGNRISNSDLTHLTGLTNLTTLQLGFNGISDLTPLASLTNLTELEIEDNAITDLMPLAGLTNLITLQLGDNEISELPVGMFAGFANLETLNLARNPGAPFAFTLELERTDTANRLAPSPADVAVQLAEGAPFEITVALSVHNGSASVPSLTIGAGDTASVPAHVAATSGSSTATHVVLDHAPQIPSGFTGIEVRTGSPLVLFSESDDHFPVAEGKIPPHILQVGGPKPTLDVTEYFSDADGDELVYSVSSNDDHLVSTRVNAGLLTLIPRAEGYTSLVVTATDSNGWSASQDLAVTVLPTPDPRSFDIDLVFVGPVTADTRSAALQAAKRWTEVITGDLPDVPVPYNSILCMPVEQRFFGTIDDLVVFVAVESLTGASGHGGLCNWRADSSLPYMGYSVLDTELVAWGGESLARVILHEMGHALGFGPLWHNSGFLQDSGGADPHFNGPLAIEAFDAAGGTNYTAGAKVPVSADEGHWRFGGELMSSGSALSAITVQSLADLGYVVDVSQADPFQLPSTAKAVADQDLDLRNDILQGPIRVADEKGHIVRVIRP